MTATQPVTDARPTPAISRRDRSAAQSSPGPHNEVVLVGRLSGGAEARELPSGDVIVVWRLVVPRDPAREARRATTASTPKVDTIDCSTFAARVRQRSAGWPDGAWLEVRGQLRRRFWQTPGGPQSRYEVEVDTAKVVSRRR